MSGKISNKGFAEIFDTIAPQFDKIVNKYSVSRRVHFFSKFAKGNCLEVGAGSGAILSELKKSHEITAADISPEMVKVLKSKGVNSVVADAEKLPFASSSFNTVIASEVIYYLDHPEKFIKEARRILKNDGVLLLSSATRISKYYQKTRSILRILGFNSMYFDDKNAEFISKEDLLVLLKENNFEIMFVEEAVILPFSKLDFANKMLEKTIISKLAAFTFVVAKK